MLMRDQGFVIFKHLLSIGTESPSGQKRKLSSPTEDSAGNKRAKSSNEDSNESESAPPKETTVKPTTISLTKPKPKTVHVDTLLAFTYFDVNRTSQMLERDLEELLLRFGPLNLTRSKIRPLLKKLAVKDGLFSYRTLTDKSTSNTPLPVCYKLPSDEEIVQSVVSFDMFVRRLKGLRGSESGGFVEGGPILVEINGQAIDVANTLKTLEKAQTDLHSLDLKFKEAQNEIGITLVVYICDLDLLSLF